MKKRCFFLLEYDILYLSKRKGEWEQEKEKWILVPKIPNETNRSHHTENQMLENQPFSTI